ncbi:MAG TPA: hemerythrin domain-containing protein [Blastocatellia bacterium]|nr:hemerythrin domain-containing protein [Acidobacteriota bacterium]HMX30155.1 hemerythrin domain-containing protein [Blastocatellia bacterium]
MAITIGRKLESDYANPLGMLSDCHRRIEKFLNLLLAVTKQAQGKELNDEYHTAFATALRYFREGAPKHTRDEEDSLFPRMRQAAGQQALQVLARLEELQQDHAVADAGHHTVEVLGSRWLAEGHLTPADTQALTQALERLHALYQRHIVIEDTEVFPLAGRILMPEEIHALAHEMAARRGVRLDAQMLLALQTTNQ